jgi:acetate kinase
MDTGRILVVDAGSHSLRLVVVTADGRRAEARASESPPTSADARSMLDAFLDEAGDFDAVGYRLVHGGPEVMTTTLVSDAVLDAVRRAAPLAPLHVPPVLDAIATVRQRVPGVPHVIAVDTAFHAGMSEAARTYALPWRWRDEWDLRRYGFHGLSYASALPRAARLLGRHPNEMSCVLAHLGGGSSVCAVRDGRSVWTSMGHTPLDGLVMATGSGSVDPGIILDLAGRREVPIEQLTDSLQHQSGLLGLSRGRSSDTRDLVVAAAAGDRDAVLALDVFALAARQGIAAAAVCLDRLDALVFTGEIGEDQPELREAICAGLGVLGLAGELDPVINVDAVISKPGVAVPVVTLTVAEDMQVAEETRGLLAR